MRIWVTVDTDGTGTIERHEFQETLQVLQSHQSKNVLDKMGFTDANVRWTIFSLICFLALGILFIFFGIKTFEKSGTFESMVNSLFPIGFAGGVSAGGVN